MLIGVLYYAVNEFIVKRISTGTIISNIALSDNIEITDNYKYLTKYDMDNLHNNIKKIMEDNTKSHDEKKVLLSYLFGLYGSGDITLIVDECHLYGYRGRSSNISWVDDFLSIHRHIFTDRKFDVVLITQVPSRLNTEIANQVEVAIKAIPASQRLVTSMLEYSVFGSVDALKKNDPIMRMKRQIIKGSEKVFSLYQSGYINKGSADFRKKLFLLLGFILVVIVFVFFQFGGLVSGKALHSDKSIARHKKEKKSLHDSNKSKKIDENNSLVQEDYSPSFRVFCRIVPFEFDDAADPNWFYTEIKKDYKIYCVRKPIKKNGVIDV